MPCLSLATSYIVLYAVIWIEPGLILAPGGITSTDWGQIEGRLGAALLFWGGTR